MIIEFTGPSGSGKSSTILALKQALDKNNIPVLVIGEGEVSSKFAVPEYITNVNSHNIRTDLAVTFNALLSFIQNFHFTFLVIKNILKMKCGIIERISVFRSIWRKIGILDYVRRMKSPPPVVLFDEGTVHSAHNMLVTTTGEIDIKNVHNFCYYVPLPDMLVILTAPKEKLIKRLNFRGDWSPRVKGCESLLNIFVNQAVLLYQAINDELGQKVENFIYVDSSNHDLNMLIEKILKTTGKINE